jgi:hypothetical protein
MKKLVNGQLIDLTSEEIAEREAEEAQALTEKQAKINAETDKENNKTSGKAKLKELGLTDAQIDALLGV